MVVSVDRGLRAFGGAPLDGDRWLRALYLDESGIGDPAKDPYLVVAGVMISADYQWGVVSRHLKDILDRYTPIGIRRPAFLHAKDIFHGVKDFHRDNWPLEVRMRILDELSLVPSLFNLPVVWSALDREALRKEHPSNNKKDLLLDAYSVAATVCFLQAEYWMRTHGEPGEVVSITLELNNELQSRIPSIYAYMQEPELDQLEPNWQHYLPLTKVMDAPSYQPKTGASVLQLADFCAFAIKRWATKGTHGLRLMEPFRSKCVMHNQNDGAGLDLYR